MAFYLSVKQIITLKIVINSLSGRILKNATVEFQIFTQSCDIFKNFMLSGHPDFWPARCSGCATSANFLLVLKTPYRKRPTWKLVQPVHDYAFTWYEIL